MKIHPRNAFSDNYIWFLQTDTGKALCVDPGEAEPVISFVEDNQLKLEVILLTHHHFDHIGGVGELLRLYPDLKIYAPDDSRIGTQCFHDKSFKFYSLEFQVLEIPGHTSTHIAYFEKTTHSLFCGDTLFSAGCGRVFDGTLEQLFASLNLLKTLPDDTKIYCGHEYTANNLRFATLVEPENLAIKEYAERIKSLDCSLPSTLKLEKEVNPFLRVEEIGVKDYAVRAGAISEEPLEVFRQLRLDKDRF